MTIKLTPYITLEGRTQEAIQFYRQVMGAEVLSILTYGDMPDLPDTFPDAMRSLVAHAKVQVGGTELMFSDTPGGTPVESGKRVTICVTTDSVEESRRIFEALEQGGKVNMAFREEPFSPGFGDVTDKFGVTFQVYTELG